MERWRVATNGAGDRTQEARVSAALLVEKGQAQGGGADDKSGGCYKGMGMRGMRRTEAGPGLERPEVAGDLVGTVG